MRPTLIALGAAFAAVGMHAALAQSGAAQDDGTQGTAQDLAWHSKQQAYLAGLSREEGWRYMPGGLRWRYLEYAASDAKPSVEDIVTVHYAGRLIDGTEFDSSYARGEPATFPLARLIKGWQLAIPEMGVGDVIEVAIPADLAYGPAGKGPIPGGATLVFKVELIGFEEQ